MEDRVEEEDTVGRTASILRKLGEQEFPRAVRESSMVIML